MGWDRQALIGGTVVRPQVRLLFGAGEVHAATGQPLSVWVRGLPRSRRVEADGAGRCVWVVMAFGPDATVMLTEAGFAVVLVEQFAASGVPVAAADRPLAEPHPDRPGLSRVFPRLAGVAHTVELLGDKAVYEPATGTLSVPRSALIPPPSGVTVSQSLLPASWPPALPGPVLAAARRLAAAPDLAGEEDRSAYAAVAAVVGGIPAWFGLHLDPYQRAGALAAVAGHTALCDPPGLGKTRTILAALAATGARRSVIVTPPFPVVTHWERETAASRLAEHTGSDGAVVTLQARRKLPALPPSGVVLVPDTLLAARPEVVDLIAAWAPDGFAVDEVHRAKTWDALRSQAVRRVARSCSGIRMAASGTPMLANAHEMASMLAICGHLKPVFGGLTQFEQDFCVQNKFGGWSSRKRSLPRLKLLLDEHVWVRRPKVMATAKRRYVEFIDPDTAVWSAAHAAVNDTIDRWLHRVISATAAPPDDDQILDWVRTQLGLITQMRRAAGLAKVDGIAERATAWVQGYTSIDDTTGATVYERPLIIWTWHQEVSEALAKAVPAKIGAAGVIIGSTKPAERSRLVDAYQAGEVPVLVCSIPTVGVGVTLTRGCDAWIAETSWTPGEITQCEDRQHRRGQDRDVVVTTFIAPGTLDERVQDVLAAKGSDLEVVLSGGDNDVAVLSRSTVTESANLLLALVHDRIPVVSRRRGSRAA